ncbi:MAG: sle [Actinomycetia bacterium]|nr:sle [Actinomycetes bacterium]
MKVTKIPPNRLPALAKNGLGSKAPNLERTPEPKRTAMLTAVVRHLEAAVDDALDLFTLLMQVKLISAAKTKTRRCDHQQGSGRLFQDLVLALNGLPRGRGVAGGA